MKKVLFAIIVTISVMSLYSCGESRSGQRQATVLCRVKEVNTNHVNWVRLTPVEASVFQVNDSLTIDKSFHRVSYDQSDSSNFIKVYIVSMVNSKEVEGKEK